MLGVKSIDLGVIDLEPRNSALSHLISRKSRNFKAINAAACTNKSKPCILNLIQPRIRI